ncbi:aspartate/glutamate racemase family protein [soil metagenome]
MKKVGLVGGISWFSTADYYRYINLEVNKRLGRLNFAELLLYSVNYQRITDNNARDDWESTFQIIESAAGDLKKGGATAIVLCANTMHKLADQLEAKLQLPIIHIATATANAIHQQQLKKVALLGTKFTMELDFFKDKLSAQKIECIIPNEEDRQFIHRTIGEELGGGIILESTKKRYLAIIDTLIAAGAEGIILGCTEIPMLLKPEDIAVPSFDTTYLHSMAVVDYMLS